MICGGGGWQGIDSPSESTCGTIAPLSPHPSWSMTSMPEGRCMVEGVLLLDETVLWINGAQRGAQGFGVADTPALEALIYNPTKQTWTKAGTSGIARLYHSVALMLLDGTILIAGSNPNEMPVLLKDIDLANQYKAFPTEFRIERWTPPYLLGKKASQRPTEIQIEKTHLRMDGTRLRIKFKSFEVVTDVKAILYQGGFVTHALHMGQVMLVLENEKLSNTEAQSWELWAKMPIIACAPGPYVIYLMVNGVPGVGQFVSLIG